MAERIPTEKKESPIKVELKIIEPDDDKGYMIGFKGQTEDECRAYNDAIDMICRQKKLRPFHQVGWEDEPGYHAWELRVDTSTERLKELLPEIEKGAKENLRELQDKDAPI